MGIAVYANGMSIACKAADGKTIAAFPDVCFTPPLTPATPPGVPIPYPNTAMASDTSEGTKTVNINGQEVMLKNLSVFKTSTGDEAGSAPKKGVVTSQIKGEANFISWSMDVKFEGENVPRHLDMMGHNEQCNPTNTPPWPYIDGMAMAVDSPCQTDKTAKDAACANQDPCPGVLKRGPKDLKKQVALSPSKRAADVSALDSTSRLRDESRTSKAATAATKEANNSECVKKSRCQLKPYEPKKGQPSCCPGQTPHHIPPKACFAGVKKYNKDSALCVCMEGTSQHFGSHGKNHAAIDYLAKEKGISDGQKCSISDYNKICADAVAAQCGCKADCIEAQLNESLKPTNRKIEHVHSTSIEPLGPPELDNLNDALKAPPTPSF